VPDLPAGADSLGREDAPQPREAGGDGVSPSLAMAAAGSPPPVTRTVHMRRLRSAIVNRECPLVQLSVMVDVDTGRFTVAVFQDVAWAEKGVEALRRAGFPPESMSMLAKESPEAAALLERTFGSVPPPIDIAALGRSLATGPLVGVLQGSAGDLARHGLAGTMRKVGFQAHDARIFETLAGRGGILVAIRSESRAADALALFHSYGGGNAAIGAWSGRV